MDRNDPDPESESGSAIGRRIAHTLENTRLAPLLFLVSLLRQAASSSAAGTAKRLAKGFSIAAAGWVALIGWFIGHAGAQTVGESGCDTLLQSFASNGVPMVMQWGIVIMFVVAMWHMIQYGRHSNPNKATEAKDNAQKALGVAVGIVLAPTIVKLILGDWFGVTLAECIDVGIGLI